MTQLIALAVWLLLTATASAKSTSKSDDHPPPELPTLFDLFVEPDPTEKFPDLEKGMCGTSKSMHDLIERSGFRYESLMSLSLPDTDLSDRSALIVYLATPERVAAFTKRMGFDWVEVLTVIHTDADSKHPKGWRCIASSTTIVRDHRKALTAHLKEIDRVVDLANEENRAKGNR